MNRGVAFTIMTTALEEALDIKRDDAENIAHYALEWLGAMKAVNHNRAEIVKNLLTERVNKAGVSVSFYSTSFHSKRVEVYGTGVDGTFSTVGLKATRGGYVVSATI